MDKQKEINALTYMLHVIEKNTDNFLDSLGTDNELSIPDITIEYRGIKANIPMEYADSNQFITGCLQELITILNDCI